MIKLKHTTIVIGLRIDSRSRLNNTIATVSYILQNVDCPVIVYEVDKESKFRRDALSTIRHFADTKRLRHIFEKRTDGQFNYADVSNKAIAVANTKIVFHCDCDFIIPPDSYKKAEEEILNGAHVVYPFKGPGKIKNVQLNNKTLFMHLLKKRRIDVLNKGRMHRWLYPYGLGKFVDKDKFFAIGGLHDGMKSYGPEDSEFFFRARKLGMKIKRLESGGWHLFHSRRTNGWFNNNPHAGKNNSISMATKHGSREDVIKKFNIDVKKLEQWGCQMPPSDDTIINNTEETTLNDDSQARSQRQVQRVRSGLPRTGSDRRERQRTKRSSP